MCTAADTAMTRVDSLESASCAPEPGVALKWTANQLKTAMEEADASVEQLMSSMTTLFASLGRIADDVNSENAASQEGEGSAVPANTALHSRCMETQQQLRAAIVALQFYDRLTQRVDHVQQSLDVIAEDILSPNSRDITDWRELFARLDSMYSEDQRHHINLHLTPGASMTNVQPAPPSVQEGDVELF